MSKKILVVDDDESIVEVIQLLLESEGYQVESSLSGDCIPDFPGGFPDLILLDVLLSGKDGREICKRLKSDPKTKHIPVIMLSAHVDANRLMRDSGADDFIEKPFDIDDFIAVVAKHTPRYPSSVEIQ
jgi:CheY-like chemotaxis protein